MREPDKIDKVFLEALLGGDRALCKEIVDQDIVNGVAVKHIYERLFKPALYEIGRLWQENLIGVEDEHLASAIVNQLMNITYPNILTKEKIGRRVLVANVQKETHHIGVKMVNDIFESYGWDSFYFGVNTSTKDLLTYANRIKPDVFALSMTLDFHLPSLKEMISEIRIEFPSTPILIGGQGLKSSQREDIEVKGVTHLSDLDGLELFIEKFERK